MVTNLIGNGPFEVAAYDEQHILLRRAATWTRAGGNVREVSIALTAARNSTDQSERARIYEQAERRWIVELAALVPYAYLETRVLRRPHVQGFWVNPIASSPFDQIVVSRQRP